MHNWLRLPVSVSDRGCLSIFFFFFLFPFFFFLRFYDAYTPYIAFLIRSLCPLFLLINALSFDRLFYKSTSKPVFAVLADT